MNKILLDGNEVNQFVKESLPTLIHGEKNSGASLYTVTLAANFYSHNLPLLFLCGFQMAEEEFSKQVDIRYKNKARFFTQEKTTEFKNVLTSDNLDNHIIVIKNIELFGQDIFDLVSATQNLIISGDINKSVIKEKLLAKIFTTKIFFSPFENVEVPNLNKFEGLVISEDYKGLTSLKI